MSVVDMVVTSCAWFLTLFKAGLNLLGGMLTWITLFGVGELCTCNSLDRIFFFNFEVVIDFGYTFLFSLLNFFLGFLIFRGLRTFWFSYYY